MNNIFDSIPADLSSEVFEDLVTSDKVKIERIISKGHSSPDVGWYDQEQSEWVIVIAGSAIIGFDDKPSVTLKAGDYLNIPAHQKHKVAWTDPDVETVWLAVFY
ncbi:MULTISPECIES: cupin domain-containing protein [unclassified Moritella]|uniref:cupin domain-containing protein n=1 Tax=unclassified Moritella TaxID=2637987 RepID=UPI001BA78BB6|nr:MULTISPECIES: cupin domain-containing protein [unclassified Moritella]QUM81540.1 cupin domain-containing protein [Moritella sp. 5]QUM85859.1 cupin domain-containing protein [Moritella sp. 28]